MQIQWTNPPLEKVTLTSGSKRRYQLPLYRSPGIRVSWRSDVLPAGAFNIAEDDSLSVEIQIPLGTAPCFGEIHYRVTDDDDILEGSLIVRIQRPKSGSEAPRVLPDEKAEGKHPAKKKPHPGRGRSILREKREAITQNEVPGGKPIEKKPEGDFENSGIHAGEPLSDGNYCIEVLKNDAPIPGLGCVAEKNKTITIGKYSSKYGIPEIDLAGRFDSPKLEGACSRRHAEVFWSDEEIHIRVLGRNGIKRLTKDGKQGELLVSEHCWRPGDTLIIPGKIRIALKKEEKSR
jgi:hypothetical protein